jgi:hypothetical protein
MTITRFIKWGRRAGTALMVFLLLNGAFSKLLAQTTPPPGETPRQGDQTSREAAPPQDTAADGKQAPQDRSNAYRKQQDNLKPFEPSEEIRVDKAVDFPADI